MHTLEFLQDEFWSHDLEYVLDVFNASEVPVELQGQWTVAKALLETLKGLEPEVDNEVDPDWGQGTRVEGPITGGD